MMSVEKWIVERRRAWTVYRVQACGAYELVTSCDVMCDVV